MSDLPDPAPSQTSVNRLRDKTSKSELRLKKSLRKVKNLLPLEASRDLKITPDVSLRSVSGVGPAPKERIPSDASTHTVWSGRETGGIRASPLSVVTERQELDLSQSTVGSVSSYNSKNDEQLDRWAVEPFYIYGELKTLETHYDAFAGYMQQLLKILPKTDPSYPTLSEEDEHYGDVFDKVKAATEARLVYLCQMNVLPFPGTPDRWKNFQAAGADSVVDQQPPAVGGIVAVSDSVNATSTPRRGIEDIHLDVNEEETSDQTKGDDRSPLIRITPDERHVGDRDQGLQKLTLGSWPLVYRPS